MKKRFSYIIFLILILSIPLFTASCKNHSNPEHVQTNFNAFLNDLFVEEVSSDTLSLNYSLADPGKFGIKKDKVTLGEFSADHMRKILAVSENYLKRLRAFDYDQLSKDQQLTYDIVKKYLEQDLDAGDFIYYSDCLGPTTGIQAQLPILLAEYGFYSKKDIDNYIQLLSCVDNYFKAIEVFEQQKSKKGLFMSDDVADGIIAQCKAFIANPEENFLITYFNQKILDYKGLTDDEIRAYKKANKNAILKVVIPAYQNLIDVLTDLKGSGTNAAGLYYYPEGQAYYEYLAKTKTGSGKSMDEMAKMLDKAINDGIIKITTLTLTDSKIMDKYMSFHSFPLTDPQEILSDLKKDINNDFPAQTPVKCDIKYVDKSLADYLSPAMYLVPPIDDYENNDIYINGKDKKTLSKIYTTVAHEGYPGHLYQCIYFRNLNPAPIRNAMDFIGYDEGWATYVEFYSYRYAGIDDNLADFLAANNEVILCMYARADIGIHYQGWLKDDVVNYILNFIVDKDIAESIYHTLLEEPAIYLPYAIGYLEIQELRTKAENALGDQFNVKKFHEFLLDMGPSQFDVIEKYMNQWIADQKK